MRTLAAKILIVEDEPDLARCVAEDLRRQGYDLGHASDELEARVDEAACPERPVFHPRVGTDTNLTVL